MNDDILNKIIKFVFEQGFGYTFPFPFWFKKKVITRDSSIESDLRIIGDDAHEFIVAFGKEFNVDISKFRLENYFGNEGDTILPAIISLFTTSNNKIRNELTVGDLEKAVIAGRLDDETIKL